MQLQTEREPGADIDARVREATIARDKLATAAQEAEAEADRARVAFEHEPTGQAHADAAVAAQRAINARETLARFERETLTPLVAEQQRAADAVERAELQREIDWGKADLELERMRSAVEFCTGELREATERLGKFLLLRQDRAHRASALGLTVPPASFEQLVARVQAALPKTALLRFLNTGSPGLLKLQLELPADVNPRVR